MSNVIPRSGYDLAVKILETHPNDAIETMLHYSKEAECDWLEFKAGMTLLPERKEKKDTLDDLYWDYLLSIVAMFNTRGGAFVIGVNDKTHEPVPLQSCDPHHVIEQRGEEAYLREEIVAKFDRIELKWTTKDRVVWSLPQPIVPFLDKRRMPYRGTNVVVLLVPPRKLGEEFFVVSKSNLGEFEHLPIRDMGEVGHVKRLTKDREFADHRIWRETTLLSPTSSRQLGIWWDELDAEQKAAQADEALDDAIRAYYADLEKKTRKRLQAFVPLDAAGDGEADEDDEPEFEDPTAVSVFDEDDEPGPNESKALPAEDTDEEEESDFDDEEDDASEDGSDEPKSIRMGLAELLGRYDRVVLSGEPGAGKTTCLAHFAVERGKEQGDCPHLFVFVQLGRWAAGGSVLGLVGKACGLTLSQIDTLLEEKRLHLILDALNECPDHLRPAALENIRVLVREHPDLPVVLSMRRAEALRLPGFPVFEVQAMDREHQRQFLERHLGSADKAAAILDALEKQPGGASIAQNPMLLKMVVDVVRNAESLPSGRATLYRAWLEKWYAREEKKARKARAALPWTAAEAMRLLARMAFAGRAQGYRDIPLDLACKSLDDADGTILDRLCQGPLLDLEEDFVHFRHETFQEYLCAEWLLAEPTALDALPVKDYDTWGMSIAYAAELRLPGKLPEELSEAVWKMNPWIAALSASSSLHESSSKVTTGSEMVLAEALFRKENLLLKHFNHLISKEIACGSLFTESDAPLAYLVHCSQKTKQVWTAFECAFVLCMPSHTIETFLDKRYKPIERREFLKSLRKKALNLLVLSQRKDVSALMKCDVPIEDIAQRWNWLFPYESPNQFKTMLISISGHMLDWNPPPVEMMSILLSRQSKLTGSKGKNRIELYSTLFGPNFVEQSLASIVSNPDCWMSPGGVQLLKYAAKNGYSVHEATRSYLFRALQILEEAGVSPLRPLVSSIQKLCGLLDETDVPFLFSKLSVFGRALCKRLAFNPKGACDPFFENLPTFNGLPFHNEDLTNASKRREIIAVLFNQSFILPVLSHNPVTFGNDAFPNGVFVNKQTRIIHTNNVQKKVKKSNCSFPIGSQWLVDVCVCLRGSKYFFSAKTIKIVTTKEQSCKESKLGPAGDTEDVVRGESGVPAPLHSIHEEQNLVKTENPGLLSRLLSSLKGIFLPQVSHSEREHEYAKTNDSRQVQTASETDSSDRGSKDISSASVLYRKRDLKDSEKQLQIETELEKARWIMEVTFLSEDRGFLFFKHPSFPDNVYYPIRLTKYQDMFEVGQSWNVRVGVKPNKKDGSFGFVARSVEPAETNLIGFPQSKEQNPGNSPTLPIKNNRFPIHSAGISKGVSPMFIPSTIHVYIDEAWPGCQDYLKKDTGVIAGIAWMGEASNFGILPSIGNHLHANGEYQLTKLLRCDKAFPFAFPIRFPSAFEPSSEKYLELLSESMIVLLGWVLPRPAHRTNVFIHAEHYGTFRDGADETDSFRALLAGASMTLDAERLSNWSVEKVEWQGKNFGYIPYGDLVAYLFAETPDARRMAREFQVERWPGCVPFSPELLPALHDLDSADPAGAAGALFRLSGLCGESMLFRHSLRSLLDSAKGRTELRDAVLERLCDEFERKDRELRKLGRIADAFFDAFPDEAFEDRPKPRFLRLLASLQQANHDGNPAAVDEAFRLYDGLRAEMAKRDFELCLYADLNVAVHFNDRFEFGKAESLLRQCREAPSFPFLSVRDRGRLLSSLGQSAALLGRYTEADDLFREALAVFSELPGELEDEADQTRVYRAFAALDAGSPDLPARLEEALGISISEAVTQPDALAGQPYHEHLLVKTLWFLVLADAAPVAEWTAQYLSTCSGRAAAEQHPWELIHLYRGLLAWKTDHALANRFFDEWDKWYRTVPHGGTLSLICGFGLVAIHRHCGRKLDKAALESLLRPVAEALPATASTVDSLLRIGEDDSPNSLAELWSLLPFNYK